MCIIIAMKELTPEQTESALLLKSLWDKEKQRRAFTQKDAAAALKLPQPYISKLLSAKEGLGPVTVAKFAKFLGVPPSVIMPSLAYLDQSADEIIAGEQSPDRARNYAPLLSVTSAKRWIAGEIDYQDIDVVHSRIPLFDHWAGRRCFAVLASRADAEANHFLRAGDVILCDPTRKPGAGELAIYDIDGEWVLGKLERHAGSWKLTFTSYEPITLENEDAQRVSAVVAYYGLSDPALKKALQLD